MLRSEDLKPGVKLRLPPYGDTLHNMVCLASRWGESTWMDADGNAWNEAYILKHGELLMQPDSPAVALTNERRNQHGDWNLQAEMGNRLKEQMRRSPNWESMVPMQKEALDMIATKMSRIVCGDPSHADHWDDIAGYAYLGKGGHQ